MMMMLVAGLSEPGDTWGHAPPPAPPDLGRSDTPIPAIGGQVMPATLLQFIYSEKALKFNEIYKFYLKLLSNIKKVWRFCHIFVVFSEYMNFTCPLPPWILIPTYGPKLHSTAQGYLDDVQARDLNCTHDTPYHRLTVIWLGLLHSYREM